MKQQKLTNVGKGILNRGTQVHKSKVKYNRLAIAKKFDCNPVTRYIEEENQKMTLLEIEEEVDDQENIRRLRDSQVPKKLQSKLKRQASEKGLTGKQVEKYIQKVERRMNRRKSG